MCVLFERLALITTATRITATSTPIKTPADMEAMSAVDMLGVEALTDGFGGSGVLLVVVCLIFDGAVVSGALVELIKSLVLNPDPAVYVSKIVDPVLGTDAVVAEESAPVEYTSDVRKSVVCAEGATVEVSRIWVDEGECTSEVR